MLPRRAVIMAHTLAAALALAAMWRSRGALLACSAADLAHVPVSRRVRGGYLMTEQRLQRLRSKDNLSTSRRDATIGAPGAALPGREMAASADADAGAGLRSEFLQVLLSRRRDLQGQPLSLSRECTRLLHGEFGMGFECSDSSLLYALGNSGQIQI
jgi:hypothetical protein